MSDELLRRKRALYAIVAVVVLIGLTGVTIALLAEDGTSPTVTSPTTVDPLTVEGQCRSEAIARFPVTPDPAVAPEFTATGAVERWVGTRETSTTTNTGEDAKLVAISRTGQLPRVVLTVERVAGAWSITETTACLAPDNRSVACQPRLRVKKSAYVREQISALTSAGQERFLGNGTLRFVETATLEGCSRPLAPRGEIGPVSTYAAGSEDAAVVTDETGAGLLR